MVDSPSYGDHRREFTLPIKTYSPSGIRQIVLLMLAPAIVVVVVLAAATITMKSLLRSFRGKCVCILSPASHVTRVPVNPQCTVNPGLPSSDWLHGACHVTWAAGPAAATNKR